MLSIMLAFIYIFILAYIYGNAAAFMVYKKTGYEIRRITAYVWMGLVIFTVYAQFFSLFAPVGFLANLILLAAGVGLALFFRKSLKQSLQRNGTKRGWIGGIVLLVIFSYATSRGYNHYDTALYHAQAIRWVEEYGVVKGLGLLHNRLAYNSASFPLSALFGFRFLGLPQSMHEMAGFFAFLLSTEILGLGHIFKDKCMKCSDVMRIGIFYYLTLVFNEIVSPASDYFVMSVVFYIIIAWMGLMEEKQKDSTPYALLCILCVFSATLKFSACFIVLLTIYPAILLVQKKQTKRIFAYLGLGILVLVPFFARNVYISGRLLYPSTLLDIFSVDWKISAEYAINDQHEIISWARGIHSPLGYNLSLGEWFPQYFREQSFMVKGMFVLNGLSFVMFLGRLSWGILKKKKEEYHWYFLITILYANFLFWFCSAPMVRYGYVYLISPFTVALGYLFMKEKHLRAGLTCVCFLFVVWKSTEILKYVYSVKESPYYLQQQPYEQFEVEGVMLSEELIYIPREGDRTGYTYFPSTPGIHCNLRGKTLKEGFKY